VFNSLIIPGALLLTGENRFHPCAAERTFASNDLSPVLLHDLAGDG